ncbi:ribonuclease III [Mycoplasmatota bacterium]|nr:ribonuclease III [Mycoplasmatota bacterium]
MKDIFNYEELLNEFCKKHNLSFKNKSLLKTAFTHSSYSYENYINESNERLEFLGDSVLENVVRTYLYNNDETSTEGDMTKLKENYVDKNANYNYAILLEINKYILVGNGVNPNNHSILGDAFEALIGAIYLDSGFDYVFNFLVNKLLPYASNNEYSYKNELQEKYPQSPIEYILVKESGFDHDKTFYVDIYINDVKIGSGSGKRKKDAEQNAAKDALQKNTHVIQNQKTLYEKDNDKTSRTSIFDKANLIDNSKQELNFMIYDKEIEYKLINEEGLDHNKTFYVDVYVDNKKMGSGSGKRRILAERKAARDAINNITNKQKVQNISRDMFDSLFNTNEEVNYYYKNWLQEKFPQKYIEYRVLKEYGPDHNKTFEINVYIDGELMGSGSGKRKKEAEQNVAKEALENLKY